MSTKRDALSGGVSYRRANLSVSVDEGLHSRIQAYAAQHDILRAQAVRELLEVGLPKAGEWWRSDGGFIHEIIREEDNLPLVFDPPNMLMPLKGMMLRLIGYDTDSPILQLMTFGGFIENYQMKVGSPKVIDVQLPDNVMELKDK